MPWPDPPYDLGGIGYDATHIYVTWTPGTIEYDAQEIWFNKGGAGYNDYYSASALTTALALEVDQNATYTFKVRGKLHGDC